MVIIRRREVVCRSFELVSPDDGGPDKIGFDPIDGASSREARARFLEIAQKSRQMAARDESGRNNVAGNIKKKERHKSQFQRTAIKR